MRDIASIRTCNYMTKQNHFIKILHNCINKLNTLRLTAIGHSLVFRFDIELLYSEHVGTSINCALGPITSLLCLSARSMQRQAVLT